MDIERIIAFVITMVVVWILKKIIKFGFKLLLIIGFLAFIIYFAVPELIPVIHEYIKGII